MTRRRLAQMGLALLGAAPWKLAAVPPAKDNSAKPPELPSGQLPAYKKAVAGQARQASSLKKFPLGYDFEPDFVFSAISARPRRRR